MLTRVLLPQGTAVSVGRLFATSVSRWNVKDTATAPIDVGAIQAQIAKLKAARKERLTAKRNEQNLIRQEQNKIADAKKVAARRDLKKSRLAKRKEIRAKALFREEQAAAESTKKKAELDALISARRALKQCRKQNQLAKHKESRAQLRAKAVFRRQQADARAATR